MMAEPRLRGFHVDQNEAYPPMLGGLRVGPRQTHDPGRLDEPAWSRFRSVDNVIIAIPHRPCAERRQVRAGFRFAVPLTPLDFPASYRRQMGPASALRTRGSSGSVPACERRKYPGRAPSCTPAPRCKSPSGLATRSCPPYSSGQCMVSQPFWANSRRIVLVCSQFHSSGQRPPPSQSEGRACWTNSRRSLRKASSSALNLNSLKSLLL